MAGDFLQRLTLHRTRRLLARSHARLVGLVMGLAYLVTALYLSLDLFFIYWPDGYSWGIYPRTGQYNWWDFPYLLVLTPHATLILPFMQLEAFALTAVTVGMASGATFVLLLRYGRRDPEALEGPFVLGLSLLGVMCAGTALVMEGAARWIADSSPQGFIDFMYAWYLYPLEVAVNVAILYVFDHLLWLVEAKRTGTGPAGTSHPASS